MMTCVSSALIVGGGIAGLSTAIALAKIGVHCDVLELGEGPVGAGMSLSGRVLDVLDTLGVYDEAYASGAPFTPEMAAPVMKDLAGKADRHRANPARKAGRQTGGARISPGFRGDPGTDGGRSGRQISSKGSTIDTIEDGSDAALVTLKTWRATSL